MRTKDAGTHTESCAAWLELHSPVVNFNYNNKSHLFDEDQEEGVDYVCCLLCGELGWDLRFRNMVAHVKKVHGVTPGEYVERFDGALLKVEGILERRKATVREKYNVDNVFQLEEVKEKVRQHYEENGEEMRAKAAVTNLERYGHENPFGSVEIQEKIRQTNLQVYGVEFPTQNPEVMERRVQTLQDRYGVSHYSKTEEFRIRMNEISTQRRQEREKVLIEAGEFEICPYCDFVFRKITSTHKAFCSGWPDAKKPRECLCGHTAPSFTTMGRHHRTCDVWQKRDVQKVALQRRVLSCLEEFGTENPMQNPEVRQRQVETCIERFGVPNAMKDPEIAMKAFINGGGPPRTFEQPNKLEQYVDENSPERMLYTGDFTYWVRSPERNRNPDFVVLTEDQWVAHAGGLSLEDIKVGQVVEIFGDYWHSEKFTGKDRRTHQKEVEDFYVGLGVDCLVLWESDLKKYARRTFDRLRGFLVFPR